MTNMQIYEIKRLKSNLDKKILNLIKDFEEKTSLEVIDIYIDRADISEMSGPRRSAPIAVETQAMLAPTIMPKGGSE